MLASTSEVYGKNERELDEGADGVYGLPPTSRWCYATSKLAAEHYAHAYGAQGLRFAVVRYFNVYGPGLDSPGEGRVISKFIGHLQRGTPLPLVDGGHAVRAFCYIDDAVRATVGLGDALLTGEAVGGRTFNIGRREPVTMRDLAARMVSLSGHTGGVIEVSGAVHFGPGFEEIQHRVPDTSALEAATGFVAGTSLDEGLALTLRHYHLLAPAAAAQAASAPPSLLPWVRPCLEPDAALMATLRRSLLTGRVTNDGPLVQRLEREAAAWLGVNDVVAVSNGAVALLLVAYALGLRGKVILPSFTFIATLGAFAQPGLQPLFCDIDPHTWTMDPAHLQALLDLHPDVAAVVPVNVFGVQPDLEAIARLTHLAGATLLYDNAHGLGSEVDGLRVPGQPAAQVFSLHATKVLPAVEGGLIHAADPALVRELRRLRNHGIAADWRGSSPGFNAKLSELHAAVALHALADFDGVLQRRRTYGIRLREQLTAHCPPGSLRLQQVPPGMQSNVQNFGVQFLKAPSPAAAHAESVCRAHGVQVRRYFFPPLHMLPALAPQPALPVTETVSASLVCLPLHSRMEDSQLARIVQAALAAAQPGLLRVP